MHVFLSLGLMLPRGVPRIAEIWRVSDPNTAVSVGFTSPRTLALGSGLVRGSLRIEQDSSQAHVMLNNDSVVTHVFLGSGRPGESCGAGSPFHRFFLGSLKGPI